MKIVVNTRFLIKNKLEGIGMFTHELLKLITKAHPEHEFIFLFDRPFDPSFIYHTNVKGLIIPPPARHPILWYFWFEIALPRVLKKLKPDLFISTDGFLSLNTSVKTLMVTHDLAFEHYPKDIPLLVNKFYKYFSKRYAIRADRIIAVSEYTKNDIVKRYSIHPNKIDVVYNGIDEEFIENQILSINLNKEKKIIDYEYFIYVGSIHPRKNICNLIIAFDQFKKKSFSKTKLVLVGRSAWGNNELEKVLNATSFRQDIIFTGHLGREELIQLMIKAKALVYISYFEGFGIPIIEAMKTQIPVITSNVSSMPEVAGEAAILVDPFNLDEIAGAMEKIDSDEELRNELLLNANQRIKQFSWKKSAASFWESILKTI